MGREELEPLFTNQKSFYGKAKVFHNGMGDLVLFSYDAPVAGITEGQPRVYNLDSATTVKHVKEFLLQGGFKAVSKDQIKEDYFVN